MSIDLARITDTLGRYTRTIDSSDNADLIPRGVLLRGAYRIVVGAKRGTPANSGAPPSFSETRDQTENFTSDRAAKILRDACARLASYAQGEVPDISEIAKLFVQAEKAEYEDLERHYDQLIETLTESDRNRLEVHLSNSVVKVGVSCTDWVSMARDAPDVVELLLRHSCGRDLR